MIDDIVIDFLSSWNFASKNDISRKYNSTVNLSKFVSNEKILSGVILFKVTLGVTWI